MRISTLVAPVRAYVTDVIRTEINAEEGVVERIGIAIGIFAAPADTARADLWRAPRLIRVRHNTIAKSPATVSGFFYEKLLRGITLTEYLLRTTN